MMANFVFVLLFLDCGLLLLGGHKIVILWPRTIILISLSGSTESSIVLALYGFTYVCLAKFSFYQPTSPRGGVEARNSSSLPVNHYFTSFLDHYFYHCMEEIRLFYPFHSTSAYSLVLNRLMIPNSLSFMANDRIKFEVCDDNVS